MSMVQGTCLCCGGATAGRPDRRFIEDVGPVHQGCYDDLVAAQKGSKAERTTKANDILAMQRDRMRTS